MSYPTNTLQTVATFQKGGLAQLQNSFCFIDTSNKKFQNFNKISANLGSTVTFDLPPRMTTTAGQVASWGALNQREATFSVNQSVNTSYTVTDPDRIFNIDKPGDSYMPKFMQASTAEIGSFMEADVARNAISGVVNINKNSPAYNTPNVLSGPFRFAGNGITPVNSYQQLQQFITNFKNFGAVKEGIKTYLPDTMIPSVIGTGLNQFAPKRNDKDAMSWELGKFGTPPVEYYESNLLPIHYSGNVGNNATVLTLTGVNDPTGQNITQLIFSGAGVSDSSAILSGDMGQFLDTATTKLRFLTFIGHQPCSQPVQVRATASAASDGSGNVTVNITPPLSWVQGANQNLNQPLVSGMTMTFLPSHKAGLIVGGDALFLGMPKLPENRPYDSVSEYDDKSGAAMRLTYGAILGQGVIGFIHDTIWDSFLVPEYSMRIALPITT